MKRERGCLQVGAGLGLFLSFVLVLAGCAQVTVLCAPSEAIGNNDPPPTGRVCAKDGQGNCMKRWYCTCP